MQKIFNNDPSIAFDDGTFMDYTAKLKELVRDGYHIDSHEFTKTEGYNGYWVIVVSRTSTPVGPG